MGDRAIRYYRELRADPLSMTRARCAAFGRRFHDLTEANLALRKAIQEEERVVFSVPDSERLAIIQAESVATRRLLSLELEMAIRALEENPMDAEEARRAFTAAQPEYARNNAVYSHLDRCICALRGSHSTPRTEDIDFFEKFTRIGAERYLAIALPF
ncbi:hypothetical protein F4860DRAFT_429301 [Xylaria cubensis]|nr:hypothetical protein F4860DRAFT_429301 [Xylaria cubensis]